ncbi:hypothetical protein HY950_03335 [Candidatus Gottesmanbacteria bacterium]|nr:hypothetical protein [Candidatus Gottesmanbacteria bacterium]
MVRGLLELDKDNEYVLFGASLRKRYVYYEYYERVKTVKNGIRLVVIPVPSSVLDFLWNTLHIVPIEWFTGPLDVFWSSDWTQPPLARAKGVTTIHDLIALKYPSETDARIVATHKRRLSWVVKECKAILCDSESTKKDVEQLLNISRSKQYVVYPGH